MAVSIPEGAKMEQIVDELHGINESLQAMSGNYDLTDYKSITRAIRNGDGEQIPNGLVFTVPHEVYGDIDFVVRRKNVDKAILDPDKPTCTIQTKYLLSVNGGSSAATFQYDRPEAFTSVATAIPANTIVQFTATTYGGWTAGTYHFTPTVQLPVGTKLCINGYQNTPLTSLSVVAYSNAKGSTTLGTFAIASGDGGATVDLGTWEASGNNHPQRISYGSNNEAQSNVFQFLNGDSGSGYMDSIWTPKTDFDMMDASFTSKKGFLGGFPDDFRDCIALGEIKNITNNVFESSPYAVNQAYTHGGYFWLPSRKEIYGSNETANEDSEVQLPYYATVGTTDADKLMYAKGASSPTTYWLRTPYASHATYVRLCYTGNGGALNYDTARGSLGVAPLAILA